MGLKQIGPGSVLVLSISLQVQAASGDRATIEDVQNRARVKEEFLLVNSQLKSHLAEQLQQRVETEPVLGSGGIQAELLTQLPVELRLDTGSRIMVLDQLDLYVDGIFWGSYFLNNAPREKNAIFWHSLVVKGLPVGERQWRFKAHVHYQNSPSLNLDRLFSSTLIEGTQSFFIGPALNKLAINLEFQKEIGKILPTLQINQIEDDVK